MIAEVAPEVTSTAVVDDRSLQGPPEQVHTALLNLFDYDALAGHVTHSETITLSACNARDKEVLASWGFDGFTPPVVDTQRLVGDVITVLKRGAQQLATSRLEYAIRSAARIQANECASTAKHWAVKTMAIPRMVPSTLWTKPLEAKLRVLRTAVIGTVLHKKRCVRCPELVVTICMNPTRCDPKSVLLYRTLLDARRILRKSVPRTRAFVQQLRSMVMRKQEYRDLCIGCQRISADGLRMVSVLSISRR